MISKPLHLFAALSLVGASSAAVAQTAAPLSLANAAAMNRAGPARGEPGDLRGPPLWLAGIVLLGLAIWGISELLDNEEAVPTSP